MTVTEAELDGWMARLASGDRAAFEPLFRALRPRAARFARCRLPAAQAEDTAQNALLKVFAKASEFTPGRPVLPWFYAVCTNEIRAEQRRDTSRATRSRSSAAASATASASLEIPSGEPSAEEMLLRDELESALRRAIDSLEGDHAAAIASALGHAARPDIPDATFRKRLSRAYQHLRAILRGGELEH